MKVGVVAGLGTGSADAESLTELGRAVESRGFESLWVPEHVVVFDRYTSSYPFAADGAAPLEGGTRTFDPFVALTFLAAVTTTLRLGTAICIVPQRNPVYTAKQVADLDVLSGGRFEFGIGLGWSAQEYSAVAVAWAHRGARADEYIEVMKALWSQELSGYDGGLYRLPPCRMFPKPVQRPHPPVLVGGNGPAALRRAVGLGDGWYAMDRSAAELSESMDELGCALRKAGRPREGFSVTCGPPVRRRLDRDEVERYRDLGLDRLAVPVFSPDRDHLLHTLDRLAQTVDQVGQLDG